MTHPPKASDQPPKLDAAAVMHAIGVVLDHDGEHAHAPGVRRELEALIRNMAHDGHRRSDPMREVFARLGDRWSVLLILLLRAGDFRHASLRRLVGTVAAEGGISQRMLTLRLRNLERDGLIDRRVLPGSPPGVVYALTPAGHGLAGQIDALMVWTRVHSAAILAAQQRFAAGAPAGAADSGDTGDDS